jgi:hypothetical protein
LASGLHCIAVQKARIMKATSMDSIRGIVIPSDWDSNGNVISLSIATRDEEEYIIENHHDLSDLKKLLRREVVVNGSIKCRNNSKVIDVKSIRVE